MRSGFRFFDRKVGGAVAVAVAVAVAIASFGCAGRNDCAGQLEVERRELYLRCLHEYSLGAVLGVEEGDDQAAVEHCAALAGLDVADVQPD